VGLTSAIRHSLSATDPGRSRLRLAAAVSTGMLLSALCAWAVVSTLHANEALLVIGISMAMQMGLTPRDATARSRLATTALMLVPAAAGAVATTLLSAWRPLEIALLVGIAGVGTWARRFGPRATALGFAAFFGCFFPLLLQLTPADLGPYLLVVVGAVGSLALMRTLLLLARPGHQLDLLLRELRNAEAAALAAAQHPDARRPRALRMRLARVDNVGQAITAWQQQADTSRYVDADENGFAALVLEARIAVEQACAEFVRPMPSASAPAAHTAPGPGRAAPPAAADDPEVIAAVSALQVVLDNGSSPAQVDAAARRADAILARIAPNSPHRALVGRLARAALAHRDLRRVVRGAPAAPAGDAEAPASAPRPDPQQTTATDAAAPTHWWDWRDWPITTRLAVQIMIATALATVVGEFVSSTRWYWAVLTAFVVFVGASTRGAILTRAYNRILGTAIGLVVGIALVLLVHEHMPLLVALAIVSAFGMMYFGPVLYLYNAFFTTTLLVSLYGMLGDLSGQVMELRIGETIAGAVIGVACAYLIFSSNSRPARLAKVAAFFGALDGVLAAGRTALTAHGRDAEVLAATARLRAALADVDAFTTAMSAALIGRRRVERGPVVHLLYVATRAAEGYAQAAIAVSTGRRSGLLKGDAAAALDDALAHLRGLAGTARTSFETDPGADLAGDTFILDQLPRIPADALSQQAEAFVSLSRLAWALQHLALANRDA